MIWVAVSSHQTVVFLLRRSLPRVSLQSWAETTCLEPGAHQDLEIGGKERRQIENSQSSEYSAPLDQFEHKETKKLFMLHTSDKADQDPREI